MSIDTETPLLASHGRANNGVFRHRNYAVIYLYILALRARSYFMHMHIPIYMHAYVRHSCSAREHFANINFCAAAVTVAGLS